jgi:hypothetical protein
MNAYNRPMLARQLAPLMLATVVPVAGVAAQLQFSTGVEFSSGDYGQGVRTETFTVPFAARLSFGHFSLRASIPYVRVRGPADVTVVIEDSGGSRGSSGDSGSGDSGSGDSGSGDSGSGDSGGGDSGSSGSSGSGSSGSGSGGTASGGTTTTEVLTFAADRDEQGFGDASFALAYSFVDIGSTPLYLDLTARVRVPTGKQSVGLGSGTTDYAMLSEFGWDGRSGGVYVGGGRRFLGNSSAATTVRADGWQADAGFWRRMGPLSLVGLQVNWRDAAVAGAPAPKSVDFYLLRRLSRGWKMELSAAAGLSSVNAAYVAGLNFIWRPLLQRR